LGGQIAWWAVLFAVSFVVWLINRAGH